MARVNPDLTRECFEFSHVLTSFFDTSRSESYAKRLVYISHDYGRQAGFSRVVNLVMKPCSFKSVVITV